MGKYRQSILDAARKLILKKGLFEFSMTELAKNAGVSVGTLYREIGCKDEVLLLLFTDRAGRLEKILNTLDRQTWLTAAEHLTCTMGSGAYMSEFFVNPMGTNFLGSNLGLVRRARQSVIDEVKGSIFEWHKAQEKRFIQACQHDMSSISDSELKAAFSDMLVVSRGLHVVKTSFVYQPDFSTVAKLCRLSRLILAPLPWLQGQGEINQQRVETALKTLFDQHVQMPFPKK